MTTATIAPPRSATRLLLTAGVVAGPVFVVTAGVQALTRDGFDLSHQPLSLLSLGDLGWIQITNFILAGLLSLAFAVGVGRTLVGGPGSRWAPRLLAVFGFGLIIGGAFVPDAALGQSPATKSSGAIQHRGAGLAPFARPALPVETPDGYPNTLSLHGMLHAVAPPLAFISLVAACFVVARRWGSEGRRGAAVATRIVAVACLLLSVPVGPGFSWRLFAAVTLGFAWIAVFAVHLLATSDEPR